MNFIRRCMDQECIDAGDDEPFFEVNGNSKNPIRPDYLSLIYRGAACEDRSAALP